MLRSEGRLRLKENVRLDGIQPQMIIAYMVALGIWARYGVELVVTSANDGRHSGTSLHYAGAGSDLRSKTFKPGEAAIAAQELSAALGDDFDVILEDEGGVNEHIHVEWQPKGWRRR